MQDVASVLSQRGAPFDRRKDSTETPFERQQEPGSSEGSPYLFAYDMQLNVLINSAFPQREGRNMRGERDAAGKAVHDELADVVQARGAGWVDCVMPKPGTSTPAKKWAYVKRVAVDGAPAILGSGFYPN